MQRSDSRVYEVVRRSLQELRDEERRHHGPREPCEYGRGGIETLDRVLRHLAEDRNDVPSLVVEGPTREFESKTFTFKVRAGRDPGRVIATGPDGRICFFDRHSPLSAEIRQRQKVIGRIVFVGERHMIVEPIQLAGEYEVPDDGMPERYTQSPSTIQTAEALGEHPV